MMLYYNEAAEGILFCNDHWIFGSVDVEDHTYFFPHNTKDSRFVYFMKGTGALLVSNEEFEQLKCVYID